MDDPTPVFLALFGSELSVLAAVAAGVSVGVCGLMVRLHRKWGWGGDCHMGNKPQRAHTQSVSRLGGIGIFAGVSAALLIGKGGLGLEWQILICSVPVFLVGFVEDLTGRVMNRWRLGVACMATLAGALWLGTVLRLPIGESWGAVHTVLSIVFTIFCVAGVTHSFNIIDGFNGLASGVGLIVLTALGWLAFTFGDGALGTICWCMATALFGFLLWNYPWGKQFLGDGGAYLLGFLIAMISVMLVVRHPEVSWFLPLGLVAYPVTETLFSMWRRLSRKQPVGGADARHLHTLVHRRLNRWRKSSHRHGAWRNSLTSTFFWMVTLATVLPALFFWDRPVVLICLAIGFAVAYVWFYSRLVRFRVPQWMVLVDGRRSSQVEMKFVKALQKSNGHAVNGHAVNGHAVNGHVQVAQEDSVVENRQIEFWEAD